MLNMLYISRQEKSSSKFWNSGDTISFTSLSLYPLYRCFIVLGINFTVIIGVFSPAQEQDRRAIRENAGEALLYFESII